MLEQLQLQFDFEAKENTVTVPEDFQTDTELPPELQIQDIHRRSFMFSQSIVDRYKQTAAVLNAEEPKHNVRKVGSLRTLIQESFFHGAGWVGATNFIA